MVDVYTLVTFGLLIMMMAFSQYRLARDFYKHEKEGAVNRARLDALEKLVVVDEDEDQGM